MIIVTGIICLVKFFNIIGSHTVSCENQIIGYIGVGSLLYQMNECRHILNADGKQIILYI